MSACPTCNRPLPKPKAEREPTRRKATWSLRVPQDHLEDGHEILTTLVNECAAELEREGQPPYFVLCEVMAFFLNAPKESTQ
jgi:hypothetical protein